MISLLRIFSSCAGGQPALLSLGIAALFAASSIAATVEGKISLTGLRRTSARTQNLSGVVVWLEGKPAEPLPPASRTIQMVQKTKKFTPHVLAIPVGSTVDFPNFDPIFHNAFSNFAGQPFDTGLYPPGATHKIRFRRDGVVRVFCNIHPTMSAVIVVLKSPYFATTNVAGEFKITGVPPGEYQLRVFHERATPETLNALERKVALADGSLSLPEIPISESGYIEGAHKNKHGFDYPPVTDQQALYPGARR